MRVLGVDLGIRKVAAVLLDTETQGCSPATFLATAELTRDVQLAQVAHFVRDTALLHCADSVWVEDTIIGNNRKYSIQLAETKGAVISHLAQLRLQYDTDIRLANISAWKKEVVGSGNAGKDAVRNYIHEIHPPYAPHCEDDQDLYDACCVAIYGLAVTLRAGSLHLQS